MPLRSNPPPARSGDPDWQVDGMRWPNREFSEFWRVGGFVWHIQRTGVGPVMLLIHGTGAATHSWAPLVTELAETYETISVDLPGHGFTHTPRAFRPTLANVSRALEHLLAELEVRPAIIVGHSAGAAIATHLAAQRNGASDMLVLINGALRPFYGMMRVIAPSMAKLASFGGIAASLVARNATRDTRVEYLVKQVGSDPDKVDVEAYARLMRCRGHIQGALRMMAHWELSNIETTCSQLELPIAFLVGGRDQAVSPLASRHAAGQAQNGTYSEFQDLGHLAHEEDPNTLANAIKEEWARSGVSASTE